MNPTRTFLALDLLRGMAALVVFFCHVRGASFVEFGALPPTQKTLATAILFALTRVGHEAVMVFFVLSGFLVGGQIIRKIQESRFSITAYAIDRSTRIFVPLVPACILSVLVGSFAFGLQPNWLQFAVNITGLNNILGGTLPKNAPLWSLAYEIWFYVFAGAAGHMFANRTVHPIALLAMLCAITILSLSNIWYLLFWSFGAGAVFMLSWRNKGVLALIGFAAFISGCMLYEAAVPSKSFAGSQLLPTSASEALICLGVALVIPILCTDKASDILWRIHKPVLGLSAVSYSLYLVHYPINCALDPWFHKATDLSRTSIAIFGARAMLVFFISVIIYFCFEANTARIRRWIARKQELFAITDMARHRPWNLEIEACFTSHRESCSSSSSPRTSLSSLSRRGSS
jgi:peptidoglycan/LPS O-acetylase OafA/YrhL